MPTPRILHRITLPEQADIDSFKTFMRDRYFPAVHTGATRVGVVTHLSLGQEYLASRENSAAFLLDMGFDGFADDSMPRIDDDAVAAEFDSFGARIEYLGVFIELLNLAHQLPDETDPT